jgi:hypothetical protein
MPLFPFSYPTLAVATIYCLWQACLRDRLRRQRTLAERVAYMLWVMAARIQ